MEHGNPNPSLTLPLSGEGTSVQPPQAGSPSEKGGPGGVSGARLILNQRTSAPATDSVALAYDERKRSRLKVTLASGAEAGIFLERGDHLHGGDKLIAEDGSAVVEIRAAPEKLIEAVADSPLLFARAAYHLGNRHVPLQIGVGWMRYLRDHVLDQMVTELGLELLHEDAPFEPEAGAYAGHAHAHAPSRLAPA